MAQDIRELFDKSKLKQWRCFKCHRLLYYFGYPPNAFGIVYQLCDKSDCHTNNNLFLFKGKYYLIDNKLLRNERLIKEIESEIERLGLPKKEYADILDVNK